MLFVSHNGNDATIAREVLARAMRRGYNERQVFLDVDPGSGIQAGQAWERTLYETLKRTRAMFVVCSPNWLKSQWCFIELGYAKAMAIAVFPVIVEPCDIGSTLNATQAVDLTAAHDEAARDAGFSRLWTALEQLHLGPKDNLPWPPPGVTDDCPFPGLKSFDELQAPVFFGRDRERDAVVQRLQEMRANGVPRLLMIVGGSGSGKSSVLRAAVLPWLQHPTERDRWLVLPTLRYGATPNDDITPLARLAEIILGLFPSDDPTRPDWRTLRSQFESTDLDAATRSFVDTTLQLSHARRQLRAPNTPVSDYTPTTLIAIDQFEELLIAKSHPSASAFLGFLKALLSRSNNRLLVIATMRSDYLDVYEQHVEYIQTPFLELSRLSPFPWERVSEVITKPAERVGVMFTDELIHRLEADAPNSDALPLLAFTLERLYRARSDTTTLELSDYTTIGGMEGSITHSVEGIIPAAASSPDVDAVRAAFVKHLADVNDQGAFVRLTARWSDLDPTARPILEQFVTQRLLTKTERDDLVYVEVAHEAMFRCWDRLNGWLRTCVDVLRWRRDVRASLEAARTAGKPWPGLSPAQLAIAREWPRHRGDVLTDDEIAWIKKATFWEWIRRGAIAAVILIISALGLAAWIQKSATDRANRIAQSRYLAWQSDNLRTSVSRSRNLAMLLAIEGYRRDPSAATATPLRALLDETPIIVARLKTDGSANAVQFSPDGTRLAIGSDDGKVRVWDYQQPQSTPLKLDRGRPIVSVSFSSDGQQLAVRTGSSPNARLGPTMAAKPDELVLWNWRSNDVVAQASAPRRIYHTMTAGSPWLVVTREALEHWDAHGPKDRVPISWMSPRVPVLAASVGAASLAFATDTGVQIIDSSSGNVLGNLTDLVQSNSKAERITVMAFSVDGNRLAIGKSDGKTEVWDWRGKKRKAQHQGYSDPAVLTFSADGTLVAEIDLSVESSFRLWRSDTGADVHSIDLDEQNEGRIIVRAAFTTDSRYLALCLGDASVRVLYLPNPDTVLPVLHFTPEAVINDIAADPTQQLLATASDDGWVTVWRLQNGRASRHFADASAAIGSPDGKYLALSGSQARIVDLEHDKVLQTFGPHSGPMAFSHRSTRLALADRDAGEVLVYDISTMQIEKWSEAEEPAMLAFSPDDGTLFVGRAKGLLRARTLGEHRSQELFTATRPRDGVFSPDGRLFVDKDISGPIHFYDVSLRKQIATIQSIAFDTTVVFSPKGDYFAGRVNDDTMVVWDGRTRTEVMRGSVRQSTSAVAFDTAQQYLAFSDGALVQLWDIRQRKPLPSLKQEGGDINTIAFCPDQACLAAGCKDKRVRIWSIPGGEPLMTLAQEHDFDFGSGSVQFTADGKFMIVTQGFEDGPYGEFARLILWRPQDVIRDACRRLTRCALGPGDWQQFLKGETFRPTCDACTGR